MKSALTISFARVAAAFLAFSPLATGLAAEVPNYTSMVRVRPVFPVPLSWAGAEAPPSGDSQQLWNALTAFDISAADGIASIEQFLLAYPDSEWSPSLHSNLAEFYRSTGRYTLALRHWELVWAATKDRKTENAQKIAARTVAHWTRLLGSLGRKETLENVLNEANKRGLDSTQWAWMIEGTRGGLLTMKSRPDISYTCGSHALAQLAKSMKPSSSEWRQLHKVPSPDGGFKMSQLLDLSKEYGLNLIGVRRDVGGVIPVPCVIHWTLDHYAAIVLKEGDRYKVIDPTFGEARWLTSETINAEASGNFMVPADQVPLGWKKLSADEATLVQGKGFPNIIDDDLDEPPPSDCIPPRDPPGSGDGMCVWDDPNGESCAPDDCGMPVYQISEPYISLWLYDTPLFYKTSTDWVKLKLSYNQREAPKNDKMSSFGEGWGCNLLDYVVSNMGAETRTMVVAGGGVRRYPTDGGIEYKTGGIYTVGAGGGAGATISNPYGGLTQYGYMEIVEIGTTNWFVNAKVDAYGRQTGFGWDTVVTNGFSFVRITNITDFDGKKLTFGYTDPTHPFLITSVTDPYSRSATFQYDTNKHLTSITDMKGMTTTFQYDTTGLITNMSTPYGDTKFKYFTSSNNIGLYPGSPLNRAMEITEPDGAKQLYSYRDVGADEEGTQLPGTFVTYDPAYSHRNSFHWNRQQYAALSAQALTNYLDMPQADYWKASLKHWFHDADYAGYKVTGTIGAEAGPVVDAEGWRGHGVAYDYVGQTDPAFSGNVQWISKVTRIIGPPGNYSFAYTDIVRNQAGRPTNITHSTYPEISTSVSFTNEYDMNGKRLLRQWGPRGELLRGYGYSGVSSYLVTSVTNALSEVVRYTHEPNLLHVASITYPSGLVTSNFYHTSGTFSNWLKSSIDVGFRTNTFDYVNGNILTQTNELRLATTNTWDALNRLVSVQYPDGTTISNQYDRLDLIGVKDRMDNWSRFGFNDVRQLIAKSNANSAVTQYHYCSCGSADRVTNWLAGRALVTQLNYDMAGLLTNIVHPDGYSVSYTYDYADQPLTATDSAGRVVSFTFNPYSKLKSAKVGTLTWLFREFDEYGRVTNSLDRNIVATTNSYDLLGRFLKRRIVGPFATDQSGEETFQYNSRGLTNYTDPLGKVTRYVRDSAGQLLFQTNANIELLQFTYDPAGNIRTLKDGKAQTTTWNYDDYGRVTNKVDHTTAVMFRYQYDPNGRLTNRLQAGSITTIFRYDPVGNLTNVAYAGTTNIFRYDDLNRLTNMTDISGSTAFSWTDGSQLASEDGPWASDTVTYGYNGKLRSSLTIAAPNASSWLQTYGYDEAYRLTNITAPAGIFSTQYKDPYDASFHGASDLVARLELPGGSYIENDRDGLGRLLSTVLKKADATILNSHEYVYNDGHQRTKQTFTAGNYQDYTYDDMGQLKTAKGKEAGGSTSRLQEQFGYAYDAAWNLNYRTNNGLTQTFNVNSLNQLTTGSRSGTMTVVGNVWSNATSVTVNTSNAVRYADNTFASTNHTLADGNNTFTAIASDSAGRSDTNASTCYLPASPSFTYDSRGNLANDGKRYFSYDDDNQLISITVSNAWRSEFSYDGLLRRRTRKEYGWVGGTWTKTNECRYVYDNLLAIQERDANNIPLFTYTRGNDLSGTFQRGGGIGGLLARTDNAFLLVPSSQIAHGYYQADGNGNITALVNTNQILIAKYQYDPFGNILSQSGPLATLNSYRFSSKEQHFNSQTLYYGFRFYDPNLQSWLNRDPIEESGGINLYSFSDNDTLNNADPFGFCIDVDWHHYFPQAIFTPDFIKRHGLKLDPNAANNGRMLPRDTHQLLGKDWNDEWEHWLDDQYSKGKRITDKSLEKQLKQMLKDPRYKAIDRTGYKPRFRFDDPKRFRGLALLAALAALISESGNAAFAEDYRKFGEAARSGNQEYMEMYSGTMADHVRSCGMPDSFAYRVATDLPMPK